MLGKKLEDLLDGKLSDKESAEVREELRKLDAFDVRLMSIMTFVLGVGGFSLFAWAVYSFLNYLLTR